MHLGGRHTSWKEVAVQEYDLYVCSKCMEFSKNKRSTEEIWTGWTPVKYKKMHPPLWISDTTQGVQSKERKRSEQPTLPGG